MQESSLTVRLFFCCCVLLCIAVLTNDCAGQESSSQLSWSDLPPLPDATGLGGPIVGVHHGALIVAGGANFPNDPPWSVDGREPGQKVWYDEIYALLPGAESWIAAGRLPYPLAYAATVSTPAGIYVLGGETFDTVNHPTAECLQLVWDEAAQQVQFKRQSLPDLPRPSQYHTAATIGNDLYVAASHPENETAVKLDQSHFWKITLSAENAREWVELEPWPGTPREKMVLVAQTSGALDDFGSATALYLIGGSTWFRDTAGELDLQRFEHYADGFYYLPQLNQWQPIAASRQPLVASSAIAVGQSHILVFGGSTGANITQPLDQQPEFTNQVLAFHTITNTWTVVGEMLQGVVTTTAAEWNSQVVIPSGEIRPGVRTARVQAMSVKPPAASFGFLNMAVVGLYLLLLIYIGWRCSRRESSTDDYFLAGKRMPWWAAGISIYATQLSAITFLSLPAVAYATNWLAFPAQAMILFFVPIVVFFYLPYFRRLKLTTAYEYLQLRFSPSVRYYGSLSFVLFQLGRMAIVVYLPALALSTATGMNVYLCILLMGVLATIYTVMGGIEAVIWTDVSQVVVLWGGLLLTVYLAIAGVGGFDQVRSLAAEGGKMQLLNWNFSTDQLATWLIIVGSFALQFGPYTTDQAVVQRYMTTRDERGAARGIWLNGMLAIPFSLLFFFLGSCLYAFFQQHPELLQVGMENDRVLPLFITSQLPAGISGIVIAGVFAASMSSLDSSMHSIATVLTTDLQAISKREQSDAKRLLTARLITVLIGLVGTVLAIVLAGWEIRSLFFFFQKLLGLLSSGLAAVFILGVFTKRANSQGALLGALVSFGVMVYVVFYTTINFYLYAVVGIVVGVVVGYAASYFFPAPANDLARLRSVD